MRILEITKRPACRQMPTVCVSYCPRGGHQQNYQHLSDLPVATARALRLLAKKSGAITLSIYECSPCQRLFAIGYARRKSARA